MLASFSLRRRLFYGHSAANIFTDYIIGGYDDGSHENTFIRNVK